MLLYTYKWLPFPYLKEFIAWNDVAPVIADSFCRVIPFIILGMMIAQKQKLPSVKYLIGILSLFFAMRFAEIKFLSIAAPNQYEFPYLITTPFCTYYGFMLLLRLGEYTKINFRTDSIRSLSMYIYLFHVMFVNMCVLYFGRIGWQKLMFSLILSVFCGLMLIWLKNKKNQRFIYENHRFYTGV